MPATMSIACPKPEADALAAMAISEGPGTIETTSMVQTSAAMPVPVKVIG